MNKVRKAFSDNYFEINSDLKYQMEMIVANAKFLSWMRSFSDFELRKSTPKEMFQWMETEIIPFWAGIHGLFYILVWLSMLIFRN